MRFVIAVLQVGMFISMFALPIWVARLHARQQEQPPDDSQFRGILALLASTRLVIAIRQATRT
jgi:hypothetical protein